MQRPLCVHLIVCSGNRPHLAFPAPAEQTGAPSNQAEYSGADNGVGDGGWLAGKRIGDYPLVRCLSLNSINGVLQHRTLTVVVCFVDRTLAKLKLLHGACAIVDGAPIFKGIYL